MRRLAAAVLVVSACASVACRAVLGIDEDVPLLEDDGGAGIDSGGGGAGDAGTPDATSPVDAAPSIDAGLVAADRRFALWPLPPAAPPVAAYDVTAETVTDRTTGLVWPRSDAPQASFAGAVTACDELVLGGKDDWRLPTRIELLSILDYGQAIGVVNRAVFTIPDVPSSWWTSSADVIGSGVFRRFLVDPAAGLVDVTLSAESAHAVRCVRGGPSTMPRERYEIGAEIVREVLTRLAWQRRPLADLMGYEAAKSACAALSLGGAVDFRLPTVRELATLVDETQTTAPRLAAPFAAGPSARFWSATVRANPATAAYAVDFATAGVVTEEIASAKLAVRCVRDAP